jgi:hypothetical protein
MKFCLHKYYFAMLTVSFLFRAFTSSTQLKNVSKHAYTCMYLHYNNDFNLHKTLRNGTLA